MCGYSQSWVSHVGNLRYNRATETACGTLLVVLLGGPDRLMKPRHQWKNGQTHLLESKQAHPLLNQMVNLDVRDFFFRPTPDGSRQVV